MIEDNPEWQVYKNLMQCLYEKSPARIPVAGSVESISHITAQTLYDCHKAFYTPSNMCLVVVGDVEAEEVFHLAEEVLPKESGPQIARDYGADEDLIPKHKECCEQMEVSMPTFLVGFKCPNAPQGIERIRNNVIGDLASDILMGDSSPLFARLYSEGLVNGSFGCAYDLLPGVAYVYAGGDSNDPVAVKEAILAEAKRLVQEGIDEEYYQRVRRAVFGTSIKSLNSFESIAVSMVEGCFNGFDAYRFPEVFDSITKQDLLDFIRDNICEESAALSIIEPKEAE